MRDRVLVVEDNVVNQKVIVRMLENMGYQVDVATNGREAVEAVARIPFAVIFMDCQMPEMDGFEATRLIRERETVECVKTKKEILDSALSRQVPQRVPIIAITANAMEGDREHCLETGMDDYLAKPVRQKDLVALLARWLPDRSATPVTSTAGPSAALHDKECVDPEVLAELRSLDPMGEILPTLFAQFLVETPQRLTAMRKALTEGDAIGLANTAHALKGSSGNMGAARMLNLCNDLEAVCRANDLKAVKKLLDCLESNFAFVRVVLLQEQDRLSSIRPPTSS